MQLGLQSTLWAAIYNASPYAGTFLTICDIYSQTPDAKNGFETTQGEIKPEDMNQGLSIEEETFNLIYYESPFGPCHGLTPDKIKEMGPRVLALNPSLLEGECLSAPLRCDR